MNAKQTRTGFSLLEILLALAILGGSLAILSRIVETGTNAARESTELSIARMMCQSKLGEIMLQGTTPQSIASSPIESSDSFSMTTFEYSVEVQPGSMNGLLSLRVAVRALDPDNAATIATYSLTRWMIDPALGLDQAEADELAELEGTAEEVE